MELLRGLENGGVSKCSTADFVESVRCIGDDFTEEDLLVRVEVSGKCRVSNDRSESTALAGNKVQELRDFSLEGVAGGGGGGEREKSGRSRRATSANSTLADIIK